MNNVRFLSTANIQSEPSFDAKPTDKAEHKQSVFSRTSVSMSALTSQFGKLQKTVTEGMRQARSSVRLSVSKYDQVTKDIKTRSSSIPIVASRKSPDAHEQEKRLNKINKLLTEDYKSLFDEYKKEHRDGIIKAINSFVKNPDATNIDRTNVQLLRACLRMIKIDIKEKRNSSNNNNLVEILRLEGNCEKFLNKAQKNDAFPNNGTGSISSLKEPDFSDEDEVSSSADSTKSIEDLFDDQINDIIGSLSLENSTKDINLETGRAAQGPNKLTEDQRRAILDSPSNSQSSKDIQPFHWKVDDLIKDLDDWNNSFDSKNSSVAEQEIDNLISELNNFAKTLNQGTQLDITEKADASKSLNEISIKSSNKKSE